MNPQLPKVVTVIGLPKVVHDGSGVERVICRKNEGTKSALSPETVTVVMTSGTPPSFLMVNETGPEERPICVSGNAILVGDCRTNVEFGERTSVEGNPATCAAEFPNVKFIRGGVEKPSADGM